MRCACCCVCCVCCVWGVWGDGGCCGNCFLDLVSPIRPGEKFIPSIDEVDLVFAHDGDENGGGSGGDGVLLASLAIRV